MHEELKKQMKVSIQDRVLGDLADALLGKDFKNKRIRDKKIQDLKQGRYNDLTIHIFPRELQFGEKVANQNGALSATLDEVQHALFEIYSQKQRIQDRHINFQKQAIQRVEESGIIFLDEIDKLAANNLFIAQKSISREGVQRDLLPLLQGTIINTKLGDVRTNNILFIASGAFSMSKVEDLIPQLLGRLPIRVQMSPITQQEFIRILSQPKYNLLMQQVKLLEQQGVKLQYTPDGIQQIAKFAYQMNTNHENMGARRLQMATQKIIQDISFDSPNYRGQTFKIDASYVEAKLKAYANKLDLTKYLI